jgi:serine/threonine protein phosphatase PrpC
MSVITPRAPLEVAPARARAVTIERGTLVEGPARLDLAAASCRGRRHDLNEDAHSALDGFAPVYVVADGVGGGAMASRASRELVRGLHRALDAGTVDETSVRNALLIADREIADCIARETDAAGAATVALCAALGAGLSRWLVAWVGDCRAYRVRAAGDGEAELLTRDDSYRHLAEVPPPGGSLDDPARMVGNGAVGDPGIVSVDLGEGDMLVLTSDGVHRHVRARDIARLLRHRAVPLARRCTQLVALARARGSSDDATALVLERGGVPGRVTENGR